jgi:hypothetical protein
MQKEKSVSNIGRTALALACGPISVGKLAIVLPMLLVYHSTIAAKADSCPGIGDEIATDRPDVTNSSVVVPVCKSRTASMSAREAAIDLCTAQIRACAQALQTVSNFSSTCQHTLQVSTVWEIPVFPMSRRR